MKPSLIVYGRPGCGKTTWIKNEAKMKGYRLFRWNVRTDRSLREGREILHSQVRSQEKSIIWIEGADDLTQEAQAFLRRILDTRSNAVSCVLEVHDPSKLSMPVLSRCSLFLLSSEISYRKTGLEKKAETLFNLSSSQTSLPKTFEEVLQYKHEGKDPVPLLWSLIRNLKSDKTQIALKRWSSGYSPWLQIGMLMSLTSESFSHNAVKL